MKKLLPRLTLLSYLFVGLSHGLYFSPEFIFVTIYEEEPAGSFVVQALAGPGNVTYELGADAGAAFAISSSSGNITILANLDREELSSTKGKFTVFALDDAGNKASATVYYWILDINDHFPKFPLQYYHVTIRESVDVNRQIFSVVAEDKDYEKNAEIIYEITDGNQDGMFKLQDAYHCNVLVAKALNFESKSSYLLNITASNYRSSFSNWTLLSVEVADEDDLPVRFTAFEYRAFVREDATVATSIVQVSASDQDQLNAAVTYKIVHWDGKQGLFVINASSGVISLNGSLDRESREEYRLRVLARSTFHLPDHATVVITIADINDNQPVFSNQTYWFAIAENSDIGAIVGQVKATDTDQGYNGTFAFSLLDEGSQFAIDPLTGVISVGDLLDHEKQEHYGLVVIAKETLSVEQYSSNVTVTIKVEDRNDNSPRFSHRLYNVAIKEELPGGTEILQVFANDSDSSSNGAVKYSFVPDGSGHYKNFNIDPNNGSIATARRLDREDTCEYFLTVKAEDSASDQRKRSSTVPVKIVLQDINDNFPSFEKMSYTVTISEATEINRSVIAVKATDNDAGQNGLINYSINDGNISDVFRMNSSSGTMYVSEKLDREKVNSYHLVVTAKDGGNKSSVVNLTVYVTDVNDNSPQFTSPAGYQFSVKEGSAGSILGAVEATDKDAGENGEITYSFMPTPSSPSFRINSSTGVITTAEGLDYETLRSHMLIVQAEDHGISQPRRAAVKVSISVTDVNDNAPQFFGTQPELYTVKHNLLCGSVTSTDLVVLQVEDLLPANSKIGRMNSFDKDGDAVNAAINYYMQGNGSEVFSISNQTGVILANRQLKREEKAAYNLTVIAENSLASPKLSTAITLHVIVYDVSDHKPKFTRPRYEAEVLESAASGTSVIQINVTNSEQKTAKFVFKIVYEESSQHSRKFLMEPETGLITTQGELDRETTANYTLKVQAKVLNTIHPQVFSSFVSVLINVTDVNDNPLRFLLPCYQFNASELSDVGDIIGQVTAEDKDSVDTQLKVYYSILSGNEEGLFNISQDFGTIYLNQSFERDVNKSFFLIIRASNTLVDLTSRTRRAAYGDYDEVTVAVTVQDENNNIPVFTQTSFIGAFYKTDVKENTVVAKVQAFDKDLSTYGSVLYSIVYTDIPGIFSLAPLTGDVMLFNSSLLASGNLTSTYTLEISAADNLGLVPFNKAEQNASVYIFALSDVKKLSLVIGVHPEFVREELNELNRVLRNISGATVIIKEIREVGDGKSIIYFDAIDDNSLVVLNQEDFTCRLLNKTELIDGAFGKWNIQVSPKSPAPQASEFSAVIAALLVVSVGIGVAGIVSIVISCRKRKREKTVYKASDSGDSSFPHATAWYSMDIPGIEAFIDSKAEGNPRSSKSQTKYTVHKGRQLRVLSSSILRSSLRSSKTYKMGKHPRREEIQSMSSLTFPHTSLQRSSKSYALRPSKEEVTSKYSITSNQYGPAPATSRTGPTEKRESNETAESEIKAMVRNVESYENAGFDENLQKARNFEEKVVVDLHQRPEVKEDPDKHHTRKTSKENAKDVGDLEGKDETCEGNLDYPDHVNNKQRRVRFDLRGFKDTKQRQEAMGHVPDIIVITGKGTITGNCKTTADKDNEKRQYVEGYDDVSDHEDDETLPTDITSIFTNVKGADRPSIGLSPTSNSSSVSALSDEEGNVVAI